MYQTCGDSGSVSGAEGGVPPAPGRHPLPDWGSGDSVPRAGVGRTRREQPKQGHIPPPHPRGPFPGATSPSGSEHPVWRKDTVCMDVGMAGRHPLLFPPSGWWQTHHRPPSVSAWVPRGCGSAAACLIPAVPGEGARQLFRLIWEGWPSSARDAALHGMLGQGLGHPGPHKYACPQQRPVGEADHSQGHQEG